jgi:hypothetical protein
MIFAFLRSENQGGRLYRFDGMPARSGLYRSASRVFPCRVHLRSLVRYYDELTTLVRKMIFQNKEQRLCTRVGVFRTPLRQALRVLSSEGPLHLSPSQWGDLRTPHQPGRAVSGYNNTNLGASPTLASARARQGLQLKRLELQLVKCQSSSRHRSVREA